MVFVWSWNENGQTTETTNKQKQSDLIGLSNRYKHARVLVEPSAEKTSCPKIVLFPIRPCSFLHPYHCYKGYHCQGKAIDTKKVVFMIRRKVLFSSMIRFLFLMDKRTLEALPDSKYCSYSKDFPYNNWQNLLRASQKLKSQDVTRCYLFKHEVQCRAHNIVYMSGMAEHILYWGG